jgi:anti-sigma regulatory factor (Ser/Thr protein kinase)
MKQELYLPAMPASAPAARALVREAATKLGLDGRSTWELMLATTEAVANAIEHGEPCRNEEEGIGLTLEQSDDGLSVEVHDGGSFASAPAPLDPLSARGRGIPIIAAVVDRLELHPADGSTRVRFTKRLRAA